MRAEVRWPSMEASRGWCREVSAKEHQGRNDSHHALHAFQVEKLESELAKTMPARPVPQVSGVLTYAPTKTLGD